MAQNSKHNRLNLKGGSIEEKDISLDLSPKELEITTTKLLKLGFERRNFTVIHNGNLKRTAPSGKTDIEVFNKKYHINVEVTKTTKSSSDREFNSIKDHLQETATKNKNKKCYCLYVSPETFKRNIDSFSLFNRDKKEKIFPLNFVNFNRFIKYIITHNERYFDLDDLENLLNFRIKTTTTDVDILEFINNTIIKDPEIDEEVEELRKLQQVKKDKEIEVIMKKIHNMLRRKYAKNPDEAVKEVSKIVFMKMYEEDKEIKDQSHENRCTLIRLAEIKKQGEDDPLNYVFIKIKEEMKKKEPDAVIFDDYEKVELDDKTVNKVLELMNGQNFVTLGMDIKGRIYELFLGSTMKNTALGQYFTPEEIIEFIVNIADPKIKDNILDPACGTGRFLTTAMEYSIRKAKKNREFDEKDIEHIKKKQIYGTDLSKAVFKIARMNMYIHGDGKSNIFNENFITYNPSLKGEYNVILTNPPFGDINIKEDIKDFEIYEEQMMEEFPKIKIESIDGTDHIKSKSYKGGAFLIQRANRLLREGGCLITVIDEGVLNTETHTELRKFIKQNFFIRAIISLPQTTFKRLAKSSPKASIIYLTKKHNPLDVQKEPVFFAQSSKVGVDTRGRPCRNDFDLITKEFNKFKEEIEKNLEKHHGIFNKKSFDFKKFSGTPKKNWWHYPEDEKLMYYILHYDDVLERLDFANNRPDLREKIEKIKKHGCTTISELLRDEGVKKGNTPDPEKVKDKKEEIPLLTIKNIQHDGTISYQDTAYVSNEYFELRKEAIGLEKGDIIIAITGATIGKLAIFNDDREVAICGDIAKLTPKNEEDSILIANFLESELGQLQIKRTINGSTNFHLSLTDIEEIVMPIIKDKEEIKESLKIMDVMINELRDLNELKLKIEEDKKQIIPSILKDPQKIKEYKKNLEELEKFLENIKNFQSISSSPDSNTDFYT